MITKNETFASMLRLANMIGTWKPCEPTLNNVVCVNKCFFGCREVSGICHYTAHVGLKGVLLYCMHPNFNI